MPFGFNMQGLFWALVQKTLYDMQFNPFNQWNNLRFYNTGCLWGQGFPSNIGDDFHRANSNPVSNADTAEKLKIEKKHTALKEILENYASTLEDGDSVKDEIETSLEEFKRSNNTNYNKLKELYNKHSTKIQTFLKEENAVIPSPKDISAANAVKTALAADSANLDLSSVLETEDNETTAKLKSGIKAAGLLKSLQTSEGKGFKSLYKAALANSDDKKKAELKKLCEALYNDLKEDTEKLIKEGYLSEETKQTLKTLTENSTNTITAKDIETLYTKLCLAQVEASKSKYKVLQEDFADDAVLGKTTVEPVETKPTELVEQGGERPPANVKKQTTPGLKEMNQFVSEKVCDKLSNDELETLNELLQDSVFDGIELPLKHAWVDKHRINNYFTIRILDENGVVHTLKGICKKDNKITKIDTISIGKSLSLENLKIRDSKIQKVEQAVQNGYLKEITSDPISGRRMFTDKNSNKMNLYYMNSDGDLIKFDGVINSSNKYERLSNNDIKVDLDTIIEKCKKGPFSIEQIINRNPKWQVNVNKNELLAYGTGGAAHTLTEYDFKELYDKKAVINLYYASDKKGHNWNDTGVKASITNKLTALGKVVGSALASTGLDQNKLNTCIDATIKEFVQKCIVVIDDSSDDKNEMGSYTAEKIQKNKKYSGRVVNFCDTTGINSNIYMVDFKSFVDAILNLYKLTNGKW